MGTTVLAGPVLDTVLTVGGPLLVILFYFEGLLIGKLVQPPAIFVAYIAIALPSRVLLLGLSLACVGAWTLGQWTLYRSFDDQSPDYFGLRERFPLLRELPERAERQIGQQRLTFVEDLFAHYGAPAICLLTMVPGIRGVTAVPAGLSTYPREKFLTATLVGNGIFVGLLVGIAYGLLDVVELFL
jgi:membrane protein DedA with SNARE-associated domain